MTGTAPSTIAMEKACNPFARIYQLSVMEFCGPCVDDEPTDFGNDSICLNLKTVNVPETSLAEHFVQLPWEPPDFLIQ